MDCVFTLDEYRGMGYARLAVQNLIDSCGAEKISIHSTLVLISFYKTFGWVLISEDMLPQSIRDGLSFASARWRAAMSAPRSGSQGVNRSSGPE